MPMDTKSIYGVEIFSVGVWNDDRYTQADLDEMVRAFNETCTGFRPPLKLGHSDNQVLLQQDGMPAAGWIDRLYTENGKLLADLVDVPQKIFNLIESGAYRNVSSEILWNADINGKNYPRMICGLALLGADMPAVTNLSDILSRYALKAEKIKTYTGVGDGLSIKTYKYIKEDSAMPKSENEIKLEQELANEKQKAAQLETENKKYKSIEAENAELKEYRAKAEAKAAADAIALAEAALEKEITEMASEKLVSPAMKPYVKAFLSEEKKEYSFSINDKEEKYSKAGLLKTILKLHAAAVSVNTSEGSEANDVEGEGNEKVLNDKIQKYAKEHNVSYKEAYKAVLNAEKSA